MRSLACPLHLVAALLRAAPLALVSFTSLVLAAAGCRPSTEVAQADGVLDPTGRALLRAEAPGENHHYFVDLSLASAAAGTYALVFGASAPPAMHVAADDGALRCAAGHGRACRLKDGGEIVAVGEVGPGGASVLRAAFDVGRGGWFGIVRVGEERPSSGRFTVRFASEALTKGEAAHRFAIDVAPNVGGHPGV